MYRVRWGMVLQMSASRHGRVRQTDRPGTEAGDGATDAMRCDVIAPWNGNLSRTESGSPGDKPETVSEGQSKVMAEEECSTSGGMS